MVVAGSIGGRQEKFDFPANFVEHSGDESLAFVEKLWAVRRVGEILDEIDLKGSNDELVKELVELSTRHGILTPYTSFMADENTNIHDLTSNATTTFRRLDAMKQTGGAGGTAQRAFKGDFQRAAQAPAAAAKPSANLDRFVAKEGAEPAPTWTTAANCATRLRPPNRTCATSATAPSTAAAASGSIPK